MFSCSTLVSQHFRDPHNVGYFMEDLPNVGTGISGIPGRSNVVRIQIAVDTDEQCITAGCFTAYGCGFAIAACSWLCEQITGLTMTQAVAITEQQIISVLQLPAPKHHCALMACDALNGAWSSLANKLK